jgi:hypothetical protein
MDAHTLRAWLIEHADRLFAFADLEVDERTSVEGPAPQPR